MGYLDKPYDQMGEGLGKIIGYILPEILLAVGSEGIGTLLKNGAEGLKALRAILEGNKITRAVLESAQDGIKLLKSLGGKLKAETRKMWEELIDALDELLGLQAEMITPQGIRIKVPKEKLPQDNILKMEGKGGGKKTKPQLSGKAEVEMEKQINKAKEKNLYDGSYRKRHEALKRVLETFEKRTVNFGNHQLLLDQEAVAHIFGRHHPDYFIGVPTEPQSFFAKGMKVDDLLKLFDKMEIACRKDKKILEKFDALLSGKLPKASNAPAGRGQLTLLIDGQLYTLGFKNYEPFQFFPVSSGTSDLLNIAIKIN